MITLVSLAQSLDAATGALGNELVLRGANTGFEIRVPVAEAVLEQVSKLVQAESGTTARLEEPPSQERAPAQMRVTSDELVGQRPQQHVQAAAAYEQTDPRGLPNEWDEGDDDAIELAAIGEI